MIPATTARMLAPYRAAYHERPIPAVLVPDAVSSALAASLRARVAGALEPFEIADRGRYARTREARDGDLEASLLTLASSELSGADLAIASVEWLRFVRGDYALSKDDVPQASPALELTLDVSSGATGEAEIVYARQSGEIVFVAPQEPLSLALVARVPSVRRYARYLTHRVGDAEVLRLRIVLRVL
jgi:hypothetical protein